MPLGHKLTQRSIAAVAAMLLVAAGLAPAGASTSSSADPTAVSDFGWTDAGWEDASHLHDFKPKDYPGSMYWVAQEITGAGEYWNDGWTGDGVDVAIIDTGVVPVYGLNGADKIVDGPDLSFNAHGGANLGMDMYGHGTHLAGIVAGRDAQVDHVQKGDERFLGMAPDARIVNVRVGAQDGAVDVTQVIAAIDWVIEHRAADGLNIRVLTLAFGTDSTQSHLVDPLSHAVERAWHAGIVVVTSAGNEGNASTLRNPATNPFVITVGASEPNDSYDASDDNLASFSSCGTSDRSVDLLAPGKSIVSLRNPGSQADVGHDEARVGDDFFLGSGTSQAAAVVAGATALVLEQRPAATPDQVKALLMQTAQPLPGVSAACQGAGLVDLKVARDTATPGLSQTHLRSTGTGSIDAARGSTAPIVDGTELQGEQDIFGNEWNSAAHVEAAASEDTWTGGSWSGGSWSGGSWSGGSWSGGSWSGGSWSDFVWAIGEWLGGSWSGGSWSGGSWSGGSWSGGSWSGGSWSGGSWSGGSWSGGSWSGGSWSSNGWAGNSLR